MEWIIQFHSIWTVVLLVLFLGIVAWAYNHKRQSYFDDIARQTVEDDDSIASFIRGKHDV
jgi:cytochrome c oxidase cbb3-type subunit 4